MSDNDKVVEFRSRRPLAKVQEEKAESEANSKKFQDELMGYGRKQDHEGALAHVDKAIKDGGFDKEITQQIIVTRGMILLEMEKFDDALKALDDAKEFDPESVMASNIDRMKSQIETMKEQAAGGAGGEEESE